jgi:ABC-2 type transport system ATP-binding protein
VQAGDGAWVIAADDATRTVHRLTSWAVERDLSFDVLEVSQPSLEDVYLELTGGEEGIDR